MNASYSPSASNTTHEQLTQPANGQDQTNGKYQLPAENLNATRHLSTRTIKCKGGIRGKAYQVGTHQHCHVTLQERSELCKCL